MTTIEMSAEEQREFLMTYVNAPHVIHREDPFQHQFDDLIGECLRREELALGCALMSLFALRGAGWQARAAAVLMELVTSRRLAPEGEGGGP